MHRSRLEPKASKHDPEAVEEPLQGGDYVLIVLIFRDVLIYVYLYFLLGWCTHYFFKNLSTRLNGIIRRNVHQQAHFGESYNSVLQCSKAVCWSRCRLRTNRSSVQRGSCPVLLGVMEMPEMVNTSSIGLSWAYRCIAIVDNLS